MKRTCLDPRRAKRARALGPEGRLLLASLAGIVAALAIGMADPGHAIETGTTIGKGDAGRRAAAGQDAAAIRLPGPEPASPAAR